MSDWTTCTWDLTYYLNDIDDDQTRGKDTPEGYTLHQILRGSKAREYLFSSLHYHITVDTYTGKKQNILGEEMNVNVRFVTKDIIIKHLHHMRLPGEMCKRVGYLFELEIRERSKDTWR